jgi:hypothetical protein
MNTLCALVGKKFNFGSLISLCHLWDPLAEGHMIIEGFKLLLTFHVGFVITNQLQL